MIIINAIAIIILAVALIIFVWEVKSVFKSQMTIFEAQDILRQFDKLKMDTLKNEVKDLKESIRLSDAGISILYASLKEHENAHTTKTTKKTSK